MENQLLRITSSLAEIEQKHYFFGPLIRRLKVTPVTDQPTAAIEFATLKLMYNEGFVSGLSDDGLEFVLMHEIMHIVNKHQDRFDDKVPFILNNIAGDLEINSFIEKVLKYHRSVPGQYPDMYKFPELQTLETYLELLKEQNPNQGDGQDSQQGSGNGNGQGNSDGNGESSSSQNSDDNSNEGNGDSSGDGEGSEGGSSGENKNQNQDGNGDSEGESNGSSEGDQNQNDEGSGNQDSDKGDSSNKSSKKIDPKDPLSGDVKKESDRIEKNFSHSEVKQIKKAIEEIRSKLGLSSNGVGTEHVTDQEGEITEVDEFWDLCDLAEKLCRNRIKIIDDFSYRRLSRRDYKDVIMPGRIRSEKKSINLAIVVDTSGSVHGYINEMANSLKEFQRRFNTKYKQYECVVDVYFCDTSVQKIVPLTKLKNRIPHGGGTSLCASLPVIAKQEKKSRKKYDNIIFFTDAEDYSYSGIEKSDPKIFVAITSMGENYDSNAINSLKSMDKFKKVTPVILKKYRRCSNY